MKNKLYLGFSIQVNIREEKEENGNNIVVPVIEATPQSYVRESVLDYIKLRRGRGASANSVSSLPGLAELCRFGFLPLDLAAKYGMNRLIDSRNCYELIQRGYVISKRGNSSNHEHIRTIEELVSR